MQQAASCGAAIPDTRRCRGSGGTMRRGSGAPRTKPLSRGRRCPAPLCAQLTVSPCESCRTGRSVEAPRGTRCFALAFFPRPRHFSTAAPVRAPREPRCAPFSGSRADGKAGGPACGPAVRAPGRRRARRADSRAPAAPPEAGAPAAVPRGPPPPSPVALARPRQRQHWSVLPLSR